MKQYTYHIAFAVIIILIGIGAFYSGKSVANQENTQATSTEKQTITSSSSDQKIITTSTTPKTLATGNTKGYLTYSNAEHGFTLKYPSYVRARQNFTTFHELGNNWRVNAIPSNQGKGLIEFTTFSVDQGVYFRGKETYPLYFTANVRVGVSLDTQKCYDTDGGRSSQKSTNVTINGVPFKKFSSSETVESKYTQTESYRTIRNKTCFVIEQIKSGSSYRDPLMKTSTPDSTLAGHYAVGETIIKTLMFTK